MSIETPVGSSLEYTEAKLRQVDAAVREFPEIDYTYGTVNTGYANGKNQASLYLALQAAEGAQALARRSSPSRSATGSPPSPASWSRSTSPAAPAAACRSSSSSRCRARTWPCSTRISQEVMRRPPAIPGLVDLDRNLKAAKPVLSVRLRRDAASDLGLGIGAGRAVAAAAVRRRRDQPVARARRRELHRHGPPAARRPHRRRRPAAHLVHRRHRAQRPAAHGAHRPDRRHRQRRRRLADQPPRPQPRGPDHRQRLGPLLGRGQQRPAEDPGRHQAAAGLPLRVRRLDQGHGRERGLCRPGAAAGGHPDLPDPRLAVRQLPAADRHHDVAADVADRRVPGAADRRHARSTSSAPSASSC